MVFRAPLSTIELNMQGLISVRNLFTSRISHSTARVLYGVYFAGAGLLIFVVPYYVPMKHVVFSISYDFGFNNKIAVLGALCSVIAAPFFLGRDSERGEMIAVPQGEPQFAKRPLWIMAALHTVGIGFYYFVTLVGRGSPDGSYFLSHAINMSHGLRPYKDFEFAYGPGLLYPTHWIMATGLSAHSAYFLFYIGLSFVGLWLAWDFADLLPVRSSIKSLIFLLIGLVSLVSLLTVGVSYTIARFVTPLWILGRLNEANLRLRPIWQQALIACSGILLVDLISPEIGTVLAITAAAFFAFTGLRVSERRVLREGAMLVCLATHAFYFFVVMPPEFRDSMLTFSRGALNFPIVPSLLDTLYLICLAYCFNRHFPLIRRRNLIFPLILLFALGAMAGALTHADMGHVAWDGLGVFVLAIVWDGSEPNMRRRLLAIAPAFLFALGTPYYPNAQQVRDAERGLNSILPAALAERAVTNAGHLLRVNPEGLVRRMQNSLDTSMEQRRLLDETVSFAASFPTSAIVMSTNYQLQERLGRVNSKPTYYFDLTNAFDPVTVARLVDDLRKSNPAVLVSDYSIMDSDCPTETEEQGIVSRWVLYPYHVRRKQNSCQIYDPYFAYIRLNYRQLPTNKKFWVNKSFTRTPETTSNVGH